MGGTFYYGNANGKLTSEFSHFGKVSAQPPTTLCIQFLDRENNDKNNTLPLGKQICFTIVWGCAEILLSFFFQEKIQKGLTMSKKVLHKMQKPKGK